MLSRQRCTWRFQKAGQNRPITGPKGFESATKFSTHYWDTTQIPGTLRRAQFLKQLFSEHRKASFSSLQVNPFTGLTSDGFLEQQTRGDFNAKMDLFGDAHTEEDIDALADYVGISLQLATSMPLGGS